MRRCPLRIICAILIFVTLPLSAQEKKPDPPAIRVVVPLAVVAGEKTTLRLRGVGLDTATALKATTAAGVDLPVEIKNKGRAEAKDDAAKKAGETQIEAIVGIPADAGQSLNLVAITPIGETLPITVLLTARGKLTDEVEPNGGFKAGQVVAGDRGVVRGAIGEEKDVDVYRVAGKAGQKLRVEVRAAAIASVLDARLAIHTAAGRLLATVDDTRNGRDPAIELKLPADGDYLVVVTDANDRGGAATHPYLLTFELKKPSKK